MKTVVPPGGNESKKYGFQANRSIALVDQTAMDYATLELVSDHLLHGDYHDNQRVDPLLEANLAEINYFADNLPRFIEWAGTIL